MPFEGDYDIALFEDEYTAKKLARLEGLKVLLIKRAPETGGPFTELDPWSHITIIINNPIAQGMLIGIASNLATEFIKKVYKKARIKYFFKKDKNMIGETVLFQYKNSIFICNPEMTIKDFKKAVPLVLQHHNKKRKNYFFWDVKSHKWKLLWKEKRVASSFMEIISF